MQLKMGTEKSMEQLTGLVKQRAILDFKESSALAKQSRILFNEAKLRELQLRWGMRNSRWLPVRDRGTEKLGLMNADTLQILAPNTAICEVCDTVLQKSEMRCSECEEPRSRDNQRFYAALGNNVTISR